MVNTVLRRIRALSQRALSALLLTCRRLCRTRRRRITLLMLVVIVVLFWYSLPDPLFEEPLSRVLLDRHGNLLGASIADDYQWRFPESTTIPEKFRKAILLYEDRRFDYHPGIDPLALARAIRLNFNRERVVSGASTLSMQVIRLSRGNPARTYSEKLIEMGLKVKKKSTSCVSLLRSQGLEFPGSILRGWASGFTVLTGRVHGNSAAQAPDWLSSSISSLLTAGTCK